MSNSGEPCVRLNWGIIIECRDCDQQFIPVNVNPTVDVIDGKSRVVMITIPNACPQCHNIRVAGQP
jgi:hypothetical protein